MTARRWSRRLAASARGVDAAVAAGIALRGPCMICGCGLDALHRVVDAVRSRRAAGDLPEDLARDYGLTWPQVRALCGEGNSILSHEATA